MTPNPYYTIANAKRDIKACAKRFEEIPGFKHRELETALLAVLQMSVNQWASKPKAESPKEKPQCESQSPSQ